MFTSYRIVITAIVARKKGQTQKNALFSFKKLRRSDNVPQPSLRLDKTRNSRCLNLLS